MSGITVIEKATKDWADRRAMPGRAPNDPSKDKLIQWIRDVKIYDLT